MSNPSRTSFVHLFKELIRPGNPSPPIEIQIVIFGMTGLAVDISAFGDYLGGFFHMLAEKVEANGTNLADIIHIVPIVQPALTAGEVLESFRYPSPLLGWVACRNKVKKHRLEDLIEQKDTMFLRQHYAEINSPSLSLTCHANATELNNFLKAMNEEHHWCPSLLDDSSTPTSRTIQLRNVGRNIPMV